MWIVLLVLSSFPMCGQGRNDANCGGDAGDVRGDACILEGSGAWSGSLGDEDREDWYAMELDRGTVIAVRLGVPDSADLDLTIDPVGQALLNRSSYGSGVDEVLEPYAVAESGWCYFQVRVRSVERPYNQVFSYTLSIDTGQQNDAGTGTDASDSRLQASITLSPGTYTGTLLHSDDEDWYVIDCDLGQIITVKLACPIDAELDLRSPASPWSRQESEQEESCRYIAARDPHVVGVARSEGSGTYQLSVEVENQDDAGSGGDAFPLGDASHHGTYQAVSYDGLSSPVGHEDEVLLVHPGDFRGFLASGDEADWYAVDMYGDDTLALDLSVPEGATMRLRVFRPDGRQPCDGGVYGSGDHILAIERYVSRPGRWFLEVGLIEGAGTYAVSLVRSYGEGSVGGRAIIPKADGVGIPFLRKDPSVGSGSSCRGACGSGCPDTCQDRPDIVRCVPDPNDENAHVFVRYTNVIECGTHAGCRYHDDCFDECVEEYGEESLIGPCHDACSTAIVAVYGGVNGASWLLGFGPYDGYYLYSDSPEQSDSESGRLEYTEYRIDVSTGDISWTLGEGTDARVYLTLIGTLFGIRRCSSEEIRLDNPDHNDFETGEHNSFVVSAEVFDSLEAIALRHDNTGPLPGWYVDQVAITNLTTGESWRIDARRWLALDEDDQHLRAEFPITPSD